MGNCIICGAPAEGHVCSSHEEDVAFVFTGDRPDQLTPGRFYRGTVDGFADFGVFITLGDRVTGLLHRSELDERLESIEWEQDDTVFVQVTGVQDNGNVDLSWSIRQSADEFRGRLIDDPEGDRLIEEDDEPTTATANGGDTRSAVERQTTTVQADEPERVAVETIDDRVGDRVRIEGRIADVRQTSGPTIFEVRDGTGTIDCAAFKEAGVRAYPEIGVGDVVRLDGEVEHRRDTLQIETESLVLLTGDERSSVVDRLDTALMEQASPERVDPLADHAPVNELAEEIRDAAGAIRRAAIESRPIVVRHTATADGYVAGTAIERAVLPLVREEHARSDAEYHYFDRQPLDGETYDMAAATDDVTTMLENRERHGEKLPLVVLVDAGSSDVAADGLTLLDIYDVERLVIDVGRADPAIAADEVVVSEAEDVTTTALCANVAVHVDDVGKEIAHLPAVSYWEDAPEAYATLAKEAGYDIDAVRELREAVAMEAYYQTYEDKRELIADLLFGDAGGLASHVSEQFRTKLTDELDTVRSHVEWRGEGGIAVLDTDAFTHRFDFPPTELLLDVLHRELREKGESAATEAGSGSDGGSTDAASADADPERGGSPADGTTVTVGLDEATLRIRSTDPLDVRAVGKRVRGAVPGAGVNVADARRGTLEFLAGEREAVREAVVTAIDREVG